jgi:putative FmdB family regulatory protein
VPLYEYQCIPNGHRFEVRHGINESPVQTCQECGGAVRRVIHPVGIVFKGSGFYVNDSRKSNPANKPSEPSGDSKSEAASGAKSESTSESKPEAKAETKSEGKASGKKETPAAD